MIKPVNLALALIKRLFVFVSFALLACSLPLDGDREDHPARHGHLHGNTTKHSSPFVHHRHVKDKYCDRPWPSIELFIPMDFSPKIRSANLDWKVSLMPSLLLFWPVQRSNLTVTFLTDEEPENSSLLQTFLLDELKKMKKTFERDPQGAKQFPRIEIKYHKHPIPSAWNCTTNEVNFSVLPYSSGYDRQQYMGFVADLCTDAEYIAMADRDTMFTSFVDREDIFNDSKPIIHAHIARFRKAIFDMRWPISTYRIVGHEMPMNCMFYFPVTIKREHLKDIRDHITRHHKAASFDDVYRTQFQDRHYSQFCIMCTYLFWYKRSEYAWFLHDYEPSWDGNNPRPVLGHWGDKTVYEPKMKELKPYISLHTRYRGNRSPVIDPEANRHALFFQSMCSYPSHKFTYPNLNCSVYREHFKYFDELFTFENWDYNTVYDRKTILAAFDKKIKRFDGCDLSFANFALQYIMNGTQYSVDKMNKILILMPSEKVL